MSLDRTSVMAISLHGPYAQLVACGLKTIETRAHRTHHRGPLLICSTLTLDVAARDRIAKIVYACTAESDEKYLRPLLAHGFELERPAGMALALVDVVGCRPLLPEDEPAAWFYAPGRWAWELANARRVKPFKVRGMPGMFRVPSSDVSEWKGAG